MNTIKKILLPIDFSESSLAAIKYVIGLAKNDSSVKCDLLHVAKDLTSESDLKLKLKELQNLQTEFLNKAQISSSVYVKTGDVIMVILAAKKELEADLIIMGTSGASKENNDSRTSELLANADCPILVIPNNVEDFQLKNIALAIDDQAIDDSNTLGVLHDLARWFDAKVHLLTIDNNSGISRTSVNGNSETLEYYLDTLDYHHSFAQNADIELGLSEYVHDKHIDILAIMPRNHAKKSDPSPGRLTKTLALNCTKPLLVLN